MYVSIYVKRKEVLKNLSPAKPKIECSLCYAFMGFFNGHGSCPAEVTSNRTSGDVICVTSLNIRHCVCDVITCTSSSGVFFFFLALLARSLQLAPTRAGPAGAHSSLSIRAGGRTLVELLNFCVVLQQSQAENIFCSLHNRCLAALFFLVLRGLHLII